MDSKIIDGKAIALKCEVALKEKINNLKIKPKMVSFLIGDDPSSVLYSNIKKRKAEGLGINFQLRQFSFPLPEWEAICDEIKMLNEDPSVQGIMIQLPLPEEFLGTHKVEELLDQISPQKDVDGLTYARKTSTFVPAAVKAVLMILKDEAVDVKGKKVMMVGASDLIGKPAALELEKLGSLVTICDSKTENLKKETLQADILISATGVPGLITGDMVKNGVVVIDVGAEKVDGKLKGDVDFSSVYPKASKITPVPGGVGPMTVISLMENVVEAMYNK